MKEFTDLKELYEYLIKEIDKDLELRGKPTRYINNETYGISRTQYFNMKYYVAGDYKTPLKIDKVDTILEKLNLKLKVTYKVFR